MEANLRYMRPRKAARLLAILDQYAEKQVDEKGSVTALPAGTVLVMPGRIINAWRRDDKGGWHIDDDDNVAIELQAWYKEYPNAPHHEPDVRIAGPCIYYGYIQRQWGHFLLNTLSRCWLPLPEGATAVFAACPGDPCSLPGGNLGEVMRLLGFNEGNTRVVKGTVAFDDGVMVPDLSFGLDTHVSDAFRSLLHRIVATMGLENVRPDGPAVWFTRSRLKGAGGRELGMTELDKWFAANGFRVVAPESLSFREMVEAVRRAPVVASPSGSTAHNMMFGREGQPAWIIERWGVNNIYQAGVMVLRKDMKMTPVDAFWHPGIVDNSLGPFLYAPTPQLEAFATDHGLTAPADFWQLKKLTRRWYKTWRSLFPQAPPFPSWALGDSEAMLEAVNCSQQWLGERSMWSRPKGPLWKRAAKRLLGTK